MENLDVLVQGTGAVGMALALALSRQGLSVGWSAAQGAPAAGSGGDVRAYALNSASRTLLTELKVWDALPLDAVTPVDDMHIEGDQAGAALDFSAWRQGADALAWIVDAAELDNALRTALRFAPHVQPTTPDCHPTLTALAEGRDSAARQSRGVAFARHAYGHTALAARLVASAPHANVARQGFRAPDVLALLPFDRPAPGASYGLVWSLPTAQAQALLDAPVAEFEVALNHACGGADGAVGTLRLDGVRAAWPLSTAQADPVCGPGWVLLGDAAHLVHPLAGQGLNLGLADVAALSRVIAAREPWRALGDETLLSRYARERAGPNRAMGLVTDTLLHLFATEQPLLRELRNRGMTLLNPLSPIKRALVARAMDA